MGFSFDGTTKVITLTPGTTEVSVRDLWSRWLDWFMTSDNSRFDMAMTTTGGDDIDPVAGTTIPIYVFLTNGWAIKPQEAHHTLVVNDGILIGDGGGDPFINTTGSYIVRINYQQPVQAISYDSGSGGGGGGPTASQIADAVWDEATAGHTTSGSFGAAIKEILDLSGFIAWVKK